MRDPALAISVQARRLLARDAARQARIELYRLRASARMPLFLKDKNEAVKIPVSLDGRQIVRS